MPVSRSGEALNALRHLLESNDQQDVAWAGVLDWSDPEVKPFAPTAEVLARRPPDNWMWRQPGAQPAPALLPGLRSAQAYTLTVPTGVAREILDEPPNIAIDQARGPFTTSQKAYCRMSMDLTMRGGTTSGVVYPNAVCEVARSFRLRNVGGASAGAIAAATAAAAERGRWREATGAASRSEQNLSDTFAAGRVRRGFAGLADATAWFSELDLAKPEQRVAQLFRPTGNALPLFRLASAGMQERRKVARFVTLILSAFGARLRLLSIGLFLIASVAATWLSFDSSPKVSTSTAHRLVELAASTLELLAITTALTAVLSLIAFLMSARKVIAQRKRTLPPELREPTLSTPARRVTWGTLATDLAFLAVAALLGSVGLWLAATASVHFRWATLFLIWILATGSQVFVHALALMRIVLSAKGAKFGMIAGATSADVLKGGAKFWNKLAGMPEPTIENALVPWLSQLLNDLSGLSDDDADDLSAVLRFGHLWSSEYDGPCADDKVSEAVRDARSDPRARSINLELISSELVHGVPYRFPLSPDAMRVDGHPRLYLRRSDVAEVFPPNVVDALCQRPFGYQSARGLENGADYDVSDLFELPAPEDLPVIFATRLSLPFPALFQAVRLYARIAGPEDKRHLVRDEYGARVGVGTPPVDVSYPGPQVGTQPDTQPDVLEDGKTRGTVWLEELWFTDGGVTSNFPVHFFDSLLPLWPTLGINLGAHPPGFANQDVWLPADDQSRSSPPSPLGEGFQGFIGAIFNTARGWHDTYQTFMPSFRGRVAWVRQRPGEGGNNLYMSRELIASLALRGAVAGRRLRHRFERTAYWQRHQWLRLRIASDELDRLMAGTRTALHEEGFRRMTDRHEAGTLLPDLQRAIKESGGDPTPPIAESVDGAMPWFAPRDIDAYWHDLDHLVQRFRDYVSSSELRAGVPAPSPDLRQVPPV